MDHWYCVISPDVTPELERQVVAAIQGVLRDECLDNLDGWDDGPSPILTLRTALGWDPEKFYLKILAATKAVDPESGVELSIVYDESVPWEIYGEENDTDGAEEEVPGQDEPEDEED